MLSSKNFNNLSKKEQKYLSEPKENENFNIKQNRPIQDPEPKVDIEGLTTLTYLMENLDKSMEQIAFLKGKLPKEVQIELKKLLLQYKDTSIALKYILGKYLVV